MFTLVVVVTTYLSGYVAGPTPSQLSVSGFSSLTACKAAGDGYIHALKATGDIRSVAAICMAMK